MKREWFLGFPLIGKVEHSHYIGTAYPELHPFGPKKTKKGNLA
jgi:hypothetical protein